MLKIDKVCDSCDRCHYALSHRICPYAIVSDVKQETHQAKDMTNRVVSSTSYATVTYVISGEVPEQCPSMLEHVLLTDRQKRRSRTSSKIKCVI